MMDIDQEDAAFAVNSKERIGQSLLTCLQFLKLSNLLDYYSESKPSFIPIFFIVYHFYYSSVPTDELCHFLDKYDTSNTDYPLIFRWIMLSLLNGVFRSRGAGWIPYRTGIRKILQVMKRNRGRTFPFQELINMYYSHPLYFTDSLTESTLNVFDRRILFHILYQLPQGIRDQDVDHIQPISIVGQIPEYEKIVNTIENYQLLDVGTNRGAKSAKPLNDWIQGDVPNRELYLSKHFIPQDPELWKVERFSDFVVERRSMLIAALKARLFIQ